VFLKILTAIVAAAAAFFVAATPIAAAPLGCAALGGLLTGIAVLSALSVEKL
jgi:hypothetical protein